MRSRPIAAAALAACTGGGPPVTSMPPTPAPAPTPTPADDPASPGVTTPERRGAITVGRTSRNETGPVLTLGIGRIPLSAIEATNREMASMFAVIEPVLDRETLETVSGVRRILHTDQALAAACHSYIRACEDPFAFANAPYQFHLGVRYPVGGQKQNARQQAEKILRELPATVKIVSISYGGATPSTLLGANSRFASIEAAGKEKYGHSLSAGLPE